jgi:DNA-binding XRE family transcriptional regulator
VQRHSRVGSFQKPQGHPCVAFLSVHHKGPKAKDSAYPKGLKTIGDLLRRKRLDLSLFQKDVAEIMGVSVDTICYWENGRVKPSRRLSQRIAQFFENGG